MPTEELPIVKSIVDNLTFTLALLDITTQGPFKGCISGTLHGSELPTDASISFPKPLPVIWKNSTIGLANLKATYRVTSNAIEQESDNISITPSSDQGIVSDFVQSLLNEESISLEILVEEVTVHAGDKDYPNVQLSASLRKTVTFSGFNGFKDQIVVEEIKITGSEPDGNSLTAISRIAITNKSDVSLVVEESPVEVFYEGVKIAYLTMPSFKFSPRSTGTAYLTDVLVKFQPENDNQSKEFIVRYLTTKESIGITICLEKAVVNLTSFQASLPNYRINCIVNGLGKPFLTGCAAYVSYIQTPLLGEFDFTFDFANPIDSPLTITSIKGEASRDNTPICGFQADMDMTVQANTTLTSDKIPKAALHLALCEMLTLIGKSEIQLEVDIQSVDISVGKFHLPTLAFKLPSIPAQVM